MQSKFFHSVIFLIMIMAGMGPARADDDPWATLAEPGVHALMRHATAPGTGDPADFQLRDCRTQRNLDDTGRNQARQVGAQLRARTISFDAVLSSQWCRCLETARLLDQGTVTEEPALNSFFGDRSTKEAQTAQTIARLIALPADSKVMLVTHQVNITALTGIYPRSGEIILIRVDAQNGSITTAGRLMPNER